MGLNDHICGVGELDYGNAGDGFILCDACGRMYKLTKKGWIANPPFSVAATRQGKWRKAGRSRG